MARVLVADNELCTGCGICELLCSYAKFKVFNPRRAAIHVVKLEPGMDAPIFCTQCGLCIPACPEGALSRNPQTQVVVVDKEKCTGCGVCVLACPYGAVHVDPVTNKAVKCELCGYCLKCPQSALKVVDVEEAVDWRRRNFARAYTTAPQMFRKLWYKPPLK
ncbi:4Fe-4S dicluster domain-containing protein [Candidatus Bathyarchaeota archaeon]|nr:MAG: 4Fe-4S dicluster domain-containing protein [Candidatus Bathyarchaeota archaeon]